MPILLVLKSQMN